jgi:hypothetical protein
MLKTGLSSIFHSTWAAFRVLGVIALIELSEQMMVRNAIQLQLSLLFVPSKKLLFFLLKKKSLYLTFVSQFQSSKKKHFCNFNIPFLHFPSRKE